MKEELARLGFKIFVAFGLFGSLLAIIFVYMQTNYSNIMSGIEEDCNCEKTIEFNIPKSSKAIPVQMTVTAYTNHPNETNQDNENTATMKDPISGWTCAVSRDRIGWLGAQVYIKSVGVREVTDLMNKRFENTIDLCMGTKSKAYKFGRQSLKIVYLGKDF